MFWLGVTIFMDPGGYIRTYLDRSMIGGFQVWDLTFLLLLIPLISPQVKISYYFKFKDNRWIFNFLTLFTLFYFIPVYGYIAPGLNTSSLFDFLQYERLTIVGFISIIPAYIFFKRNQTLLLKFAFITSLIIVILYLVRLFTNLPVIPFWTATRGLGLEATRISLKSYGFANWFIYISLIFVLFKFRHTKKIWIYFIGLTIFMAIIITLTRRSIVILLFNSLLIYIIHQLYAKKGLLSPKLGRFVIAGVFAFLMIYILQPKYLDYSVSTLNSVVSFVSKTETSEVQSEGRLEHDIPGHFARFNESPIIGYGYDILWYSNDVAEGGLSANDIPLTAAIGMFGVLGLTIFSIYYFKLFHILYRNYKILREIYRSKLAYSHSILFTINMVIMIGLISTFTIGFMNYFSDLIRGETRVKQMMYIGILLASRDMLYVKLREWKKDKKEAKDDE
jgi:hypothetical protein